MFHCLMDSLMSKIRSDEPILLHSFCVTVFPCVISIHVSTSGRIFHIVAAEKKKDCDNPHPQLLFIAELFWELLVACQCSEMQTTWQNMKALRSCKLNADNIIWYEFETSELLKLRNLQFRLQFNSSLPPPPPLDSAAKMAGRTSLRRRFCSKHCRFISSGFSLVLWGTCTVLRPSFTEVWWW